MALLAQRFHGVASIASSEVSSGLEARATAVTVPDTGEDERNDCQYHKEHFQLLPVSLRINGVFMGMSSEDLKERFGPALSKNLRYNSEIWRYHYVTVELGRVADNLRVRKIWGTELTKEGDVLLQAGDSRAKVFRVFPDALATLPHPPDSNDWRDIYDSAGSNANLIEEPQAFELIFTSNVPYAQYSGMIYPSTCYLYVVLMEGRIKSINAQHDYPCGKRRFFINP